MVEKIILEDLQEDKAKLIVQMDSLYTFNFEIGEYKGYIDIMHRDNSYDKFNYEYFVRKIIENSEINLKSINCTIYEELPSISILKGFIFALNRIFTLNYKLEENNEYLSLFNDKNVIFSTNLKLE